MSSFKDKLHHYKADVISVTDGDTFVCDLDLGINTRSRIIVRVDAINTAELRADAEDDIDTRLAKKKQALLATLFTCSFLLEEDTQEISQMEAEISTLEDLVCEKKERIRTERPQCYVNTVKADTLGRWVSKVFDLYEEKSLSDSLLNSGLAVPFKRKSRRKK